MPLLQLLSDDQIALLGSVTALFVCGSLMWASGYVGRYRQAKQRADLNDLRTDQAPSVQMAVKKQSQPVRRRAA